MEITVGELIESLSKENKEALVHFEGMEFYRVKTRGDEVVQIELHEEGNCPSCGKQGGHNFKKEEPLDCIPPRRQIQYGNRIFMDSEYKEAMYKEYPHWSTEEVVGTYMGNNPNFPSQDDWREQQESTVEE